MNQLISASFLPSCKMRRHIQVLFKSIGGKFQRPSEKRGETVKNMAWNRLLAPVYFNFAHKLAAAICQHVDFWEEDSITKYIL